MVSHFKLAFPLPKCISTQNPSNYSYPKINSQTISHGPILSEFRSKSSGRFLQLLFEFRLLFTDLSRFLQLPLWSTVLCSANLWASFSKFWALFSKFCCSCEVEWTKLCNSIYSPSATITGLKRCRAAPTEWRATHPLYAILEKSRLELNIPARQYTAGTSTKQKGSKREPDSVNQVRHTCRMHHTARILFSWVSRCSRNWSADSSTLPQRLHGWCKLSAGAATPMLKQSYIYIFYILYMIIYNNKSWKNNDMLIPRPYTINFCLSIFSTHQKHQCSGTPLRPEASPKKIYPHSS